MKRKGLNIAIVCVMFLVGFSVLLYPTFSSWFNDRQFITVAESYADTLNALSPEESEKEYIKAKEYNDSLRGDPVKDPFIPGSGKALPGNYLDTLNIGGIMCVVEIPIIDVKLPVYHGTSDDVLQKGIGHIEGTALPIGGTGSHALLTGHTGLPNATLFTDIRKLEEGDKFFIQVLDKELIYEIDQIKVILPEDISELSAFVDRDNITLITCTPYGVNSHRLLVRGERTYNMSKPISVMASMPLWYYIVFFGAILLSIVIAIILIVKAVKTRRKAKQTRKQGREIPPKSEDAHRYRSVPQRADGQ